MTDRALPCFDLLSESWIPVTDRKGRSRLISLRECLVRAPDYVALDSTNPTELFALYRLLLAVCHRAIGPGTLDDRATLLGNWPAERLDNYLSRWVSRFDLFNQDRPFMQVAALRNAGNLKESPWTRISLGRASGAAKLLFDHTIDELPPAASPAELVRCLLAHLQFTPGGLVRALRTSGARGAAAAMLLVMPVGGSLSETLALSLIPQSEGEFAADLPTWEQDEPTLAQLASPPDTPPAGPAQRYTWMSRAILLAHPVAGKAPAALYAEGFVLPVSPVPDPMSITMNSQKGSYPLQLNPDRAFWRDFHALVSEKRGSPPAVIRHAVALNLARDEYEPVDLLAGGLLPDDAKLIMWRVEERRISPEVLAANHAAGARVEPALSLAEEVGRAFESAQWAMVARWLEGASERQPRKGDVQRALQTVGGSARFWASLEPEFWRFIDALGAHQDPDRSYAEWRTALSHGVREAWQWGIVQLGASTRAMAAAAQAEHLMWAAVRKASEF